jgi:predicted permease
VLNQLLQLWRRLLFYLRRDQFDRDLAEEMELHLEMKVKENLQAGMRVADARAAARRQFGNQTLLQEVSREMWGVKSIETLFQDLHYGLRMLLKSKGFTAVAVLSLALGIGANTAIFSLINSLMLRMLPVKNAEELILFSISGPNVPPVLADRFNYPLYEMFRDRNKSFTSILTVSDIGRVRLLWPEPGAGAESAQQQRVSGNFFSVLGVSAVVGRTLAETDDNPANTQPAAVISYEYWRRRFGLDPNVVGRNVTIDKTPLIIVGVAPPGFFGVEVGGKPDLWWPIKASNDRSLSEPQANRVRVIGRLRPGVSVAQAQAEMDTIFRRQIDDVAATRSANWTPPQRRNHFERNIRLDPGGSGYTWLRRQFGRPLFILMVTVALTLLIACINIANLLLARAATRRKEIAVRLTLGAGRFRLLRQLLTESVLLSLLGGAAGLLFANVCLRALITYLPQQTRSALDVSLDARALGFTLVVSVLTGLLFGLAPGWLATRLNLTTSLKDQTGASASRSRLALNKFLVVTQVALSLFLLIGAGLFVRSLRNLRTLDVGLNYENIVQFSLDSSDSGYKDERLSDLYKQVLARLEAMPGVHSATLSEFSLLANFTRYLNVSVPGFTPGPDENLSCNVMVVGPRFFETMKMPILAGRDFNPQDERLSTSPDNSSATTGPQSQAGASPLYAIVNQTMARYFFGDENPIGRHFNQKDIASQPIEIIGVVKDAKYATLRERTPRTFYLYSFQQPQQEGMTLQFRTDGKATNYVAPIGRLAREIDPKLQILDLQTMADLVDQLLVQERFIAQTAGAFSLFALLLACIGLYGVMSYAVTRRTSEIGIRMALGAQVRDIVGLVMRQVALLVTLGIGIGLAAALVTMRLASTLFASLFGLTPGDPLTITLATLLLIGVAALAGYLPARRALRVNPLVALRNE